MNAVTTTTTPIKIGQIWSTVKTPADALVAVTSYTKGWYLVHIINDSAELTSETLKLRAKDFDMLYTFDHLNGTFNAEPTETVGMADTSETEMAGIEIVGTETAEIEASETVETENNSRNPMSRHIAAYAVNYVKVKTPNCHSKICGDALSVLMQDYPIEVIVAATSEIADRDLETRYAHLNNGQKRMNCGNILRRQVADMMASLDMIRLVMDRAKAAQSV